MKSSKYRPASAINAHRRTGGGFHISRLLQLLRIEERLERRISHMDDTEKRERERLLGHRSMPEIAMEKHLSRKRQDLR
jgi:hypothetical protein